MLTIIIIIIIMYCNASDSQVLARNMTNQAQDTRRDITLKHLCVTKKPVGGGHRRVHICKNEQHA